MGRVRQLTMSCKLGQRILFRKKTPQQFFVYSARRQYRRCFHGMHGHEPLWIWVLAGRLKCFDDDESRLATANFPSRIKMLSSVAKEIYHHPLADMAGECNGVPCLDSARYVFLTNSLNPRRNRHRHGHRQIQQHLRHPFTEWIKPWRDGPAARKRVV